MTLILIAEDDFAIQEILQTLLEQEGYATMSVANGKEALAALERRRPDLVLSDLMMPFLNGRDLFRALQADPAWRAIPFVLMTAIPAAAASEALAYTAVLPKPFELDALLTTVRQHIRVRHPS